MEKRLDRGIVLDDLNRLLKKHGLWFPVDVSTASRNAERNSSVPGLAFASAGHIVRAPSPGAAS